METVARMTRCFLAVAVALVAGMLTACGDKDEAAREPVAREAEQAQREGRQPAEPMEEPRVVQMLRFAPADPLIVVAAPSLEAFEDRALALAARLAPPDVDVSRAVAEWSMEWSEALGLASAQTPTQVLREWGADPAQPMAVYVHAEEFAQRLRDAAAIMPEPSAGHDAEEPLSAGEITPDREGAPLESGEPESDLASDDELFTVAGEPTIALAFTARDRDLLTANLERMLRESPQWESFNKRSENRNGIDITVYDPHVCAYFFHDDLFFVSNELAWLEQVAARVQHPGELPEGMASPRKDEHLVFYIRMDQMQPIGEAIMTAGAQISGEAAAMASMQASSWERSKELYAGTDPLVGALVLNDERISLTARLNLDKHQAIKAATGPATPMRLAAALPESTLAMLSMKITPEMKASIRKYWIEAAPPEALQDQKITAQLMGVNQAIEVVEDEVTVALRGFSDQVPDGLVMVGLTDPGQVMPLLSMLALLGGAGALKTPEEPGAVEEVTVAGVFTFYYTLLDKTLLVATRRPLVEAAVQNLRQPRPEGYLEALDPSMDPGQPRYFLLSIQPEIIEQAMAAQEGALQQNDVVRRVSRAISEIRMTQEMEGPWLEQDLTLYLTDPEP